VRNEPPLAKSRREQMQQGSPLFDHLVGDRQQRRRHGQAERQSTRSQSIVGNRAIRPKAADLGGGRLRIEIDHSGLLVEKISRPC
jgi:hypothetical protein